MQASQNPGPSKAANKVALRGVATLEFLKGFAVLAVGAGLAAVLHREHDMEEVATCLLYALHLSHHRHVSAIFLRAADRIGDTNLALLAVAAAGYSMLRFIEAYGLWRERIWAEWLALISGAIYLPFEIYELFRHATPIRWAIFLINVVIVAYMGWLRWRAHVSPAPDAIAA